MTIPTWNLAEGTSVSISNLRNASNWDDMGVYFDVSRTEVRHHYHSTSARVSIDTLVELNLLPESSFTIEEDEMGGTNVEFIGDSSDMNRAIQEYVDNHMDDDDEFMAVSSHHPLYNRLSTCRAVKQKRAEWGVPWGPNNGP